MLIRRKLPIAILATTLTGLLTVSASAVDPALTCRSSKNKEAGKYAFCRQKAEAKFAISGDTSARTEALQKCLDKYNLKWQVAESKAIAAGGACAATSDQTAIQAVIEAHTTSIATALAGGTSTTTTMVSSTTTSTLPAGSCTTAGQCPQGATGDCNSAVCTSGTCAFASDDSDPPSSPTACLIPSCSLGTAIFTPTLPGVGCNDNGGTVCDGGGVCIVACLEGAQQPCYTGPVGSMGVGPCLAGVRVCTGGIWGGCLGEILPTTEVCGDFIDNDCDGFIDEGC